MIFYIAILAVFFTTGWYQALAFESGKTLPFMGVQLNFEDINIGIRLVTAGLIVTTIAWYKDKIIKTLKKVGKFLSTISAFFKGITDIFWKRGQLKNLG